MQWDIYVTIALMAITTYLTRAAGYWVLKNRQLSQRTLKVMEAIPGCVLISVIAPVLVSGKVSDAIAVGVTILAMLRFSLFPTVMLAIIASGVARYFFS